MIRVVLALVIRTGGARVCLKCGNNVAKDTITAVRCYVIDLHVVGDGTVFLKRDLEIVHLVELYHCA